MIGLAAIDAVTERERSGLPSQREPAEVEAAPSRCRHCGKRYGQCTVLICYRCHKSYGDPTPEEEEREMWQTNEIYRAIRRGEVP